MLFTVDRVEYIMYTRFRDFAELYPTKPREANNGPLYVLVRMDFQTIEKPKNFLPEKGDILMILSIPFPYEGTKANFFSTIFLLLPCIDLI